MDQNQTRPWVYNCNTPPSPTPVVVQQVIGQGEEQKSCDIRVCVPRRRPSIEQIIDVFAKKIKIRSVEIIHDKVIVCGHFEVKGLYVACLPNEPVHAVEVRRVPFTVDVCIPGARCGMDADASVDIEFIDYDCDRRTRAYWHKKYGDCDNPELYCKKPKRGTRCFHVSVVLRVRAQVMACREVFFNTYPSQLPYKPKG